ncbi:MAG: helix-turn-helix domain-containing protein [Proteobacteria bacterium]|nr:helix-turn-helix domain-containing protein [Pseudomonadota bacterium]
MSECPQKSALLKAIKIVGSQTLLANAINTCQQNISNWLKSGSINPDFVLRRVVN